MKKLLALLLVLFTSPAMAQWQTPAGTIPVGRGAGVTGFNTVGGSAGGGLKCLVDTNPPAFGACVSTAMGSNVFSAANFGFVGDGVTNNSAAWATMISVLSPLGGGTVIFGCGQNYSFASQPAIIGFPIRIQGCIYGGSSFIRNYAPATADSYFIKTTFGYIEVDGVDILAGDGTTGGRGFEVILTSSPVTFGNWGVFTGVRWLNNIHGAATGNWKNAVWLDGSDSSASPGAPGLRDWSFYNCWIFNTTGFPFYGKNLRQFGWYGGGWFSGAGVNTMMQITGTAGVSNTSENVTVSPISGAGINTDFINYLNITGPFGNATATNTIGSNVVDYNVDVQSIDAWTFSSTTGKHSINGNLALGSTLDVAGNATFTSTGSSALAVGVNGSTNAVLNVDSSTPSVATGLVIKGAAAGGGVLLQAISSGTNENLSLNAKGTGSISIAGGSTGSVSIGQNTSIAGTETITSASATALSVGRQGLTNPALNVDASTATSVTGLNVKSAAAGGGVALAVISSGTNENLTANAKGSGTFTINNTATGGIVLARQTSVTDTTASSSSTTGSLVVSGGLGVAAKGFFGDSVSASKTQDAVTKLEASNPGVTTNSEVQINMIGPSGSNVQWRIPNNGGAPYMQFFSSGISGIFTDFASHTWRNQGASVTYASLDGNAYIVNATSAATSTATGSIQTGGGVGIAGAGWFGTYISTPKVRATSAAPTPTSCGTGPAAAGNDMAGEITMGTVAPAGCIITFANAYTSAPFCNVTWQTNLASMQYTISNTAITLVQTPTSSNKVNYHCTARSGG